MSYLAARSSQEQDFQIVTGLAGCGPPAGLSPGWLAERRLGCNGAGWLGAG